MLRAYNPDEIEPLNLLKLVLVGDSGVGKTSILTRFADDEYSSRYISTIGVDFKARELHLDMQTRVKLQIWDTAGQERFRTITSAYYRGASGLMLVYSVMDRSSFENALSWLKEADKYCSGRGVVKVLVANKCDVSRRERKVNPKEARQFAEKHNLLFIETSAKEGTNIEQAFRVISLEVMKSRRMRIEEGKDRQKYPCPVVPKPPKKWRQSSCCRL